MRKLLIAVAATGMVLSGMMEVAHARENLAGQVNFYGAIYDSGCKVETQSQALAVVCFPASRPQSKVNQLITKQQQLPAHYGSSQLKWVDEAHHTGIITFNYV